MSLRRTLLAATALVFALGAATFFLFCYPLGVQSRHNIAEPSRPASSATTQELDRSCLLRRQELMSQPALPGVPELEAARAEILARAKSEPVLFLSRPEEHAVKSDVEDLRQRIHHEPYPWRAFAEALSQYRRYPSVLRQVLLTDGYLYAERPAVAAMLANTVVLSQLFTEKDLVILRGSRTLHATRKGPEYYWVDGPEATQPARLWLFDRAAPKGEVFAAHKLVSVAKVREETGASQVEIERLTPGAVVATLVFPELRLPAVLAIKDNELHLDCLASLPAQEQAKLQAAQAIVKRRDAALVQLRAAIDEEVTQALPFDEPKTEEGQQDGKLRQEWRTAYRNGAFHYEFNGDKYAVFDAKGIPRIPQVCVDFVVDSWERMAGTHWLAAREGRGRKVGRIDFDNLEIENRRSVDRLIEFAQSHPEWFEVLEFPESERVRFQERQRFFKRLFDLRAEFQPGDVVAILGPRDDEKLHYHSFFIVAVDPITSMPTQVAANAGRPRIRSWEGEMQNAPRRSIIARIRPRLAWLEGLAGTTPEGLVALKSSTGPALTKVQ